MAGKILGSYVHVKDKKGDVVVLSPGQELPGWAKEQVTNPNAFRDDDAVEPESTPTSTEQQPTGYAALETAALKAELKKRELPQTGKKAELIERLEKHDAELKAAAGDSSEDDGAEDGDGDSRAGDPADGDNTEE
ncbi:hypothetical protein LLS1_18540 [Leifsonia sp. LS1]|uniref:SAP domain-containing protein n=1 Tax=Leifsonia sp. LS1 TaxID=2828483 RepID=UPI001CFECCCB|nr:SAP domain-containing protein [Leifsonia sp. LS1]GIT80185.1 hypothetical protein LLS1_18540 [Leifsonia sp. LS1]